MIDWLKNINKPYPEFWKKYVNKFDEKPVKFVAISLIMSGSDFVKDRIISIGIVTVEKDQIIISESYEIEILQPIENESTQNEKKQFSMGIAIEQLISILGNAVIIGYRVDIDIAFINKALERMHCGRLKNEALDIEVMYKKLKDITDDKVVPIEEIENYFKIIKHNRDSAIEDAYRIALIFLKFKIRLGIK
ncbi:MAG TPA: 3'-5' exonuclease [Flavobacterium sp.]|jgi:DNA polymerase-3 subunit epsilon